MTLNNPRIRIVVVNALLALACVGTGWVGLAFPSIDSQITLLWLPTGIAVGALLRWGFGSWPGIALGAVIVKVITGASWSVAAGIAVGSTLAPVLTAWLLLRMKFHQSMDRNTDICLLAAAALLGMTVSSGLGVFMHGLPEPRLATWLAWWGGDTMGVILAAPLVLLLTRSSAGAIARRRIEFGFWLVATVAVAWAVFVFNRGSDGQAWALAFVPLPFLAWGTLRFGAIGTSLGIIVITAVAAYGTATGRGPFFSSNPVADMAVLWAYMATSTVLGWLITTLQAAQLQASGTQRLFEQALSDVSLGVLLAGCDRKITYANEGFTRLTGYTEAELLGRSCALLQGPDTDSVTITRLQDALNTTGFFDGEILNYRKDGTTFWNALLLSPVLDERGELTGFLGIQRDITAHKQAELALHQSAEHLRTIIELEPECVKIISPDGKLLEMNPAGLAMIEAGSLDEVRDRPITNLIASEDRAAYVAMHEQVLKGATGRCEFGIVGLKGSRRSMETHAVPYRNSRREIVGVLGITRDVTESKAAAREFNRSFATLQLFIDTVPAYISFVDVDERYRLVNKRYEEYFGQPAERLVGQRVRDVQPPAAYAEMEPHIRAALAGKAVRYESNPTGPDGGSFWFEVQYIPRRGEDGAVTGFFVLVFDISDRKRDELALQESRSRLDSILNSLDDVVWSSTADAQAMIFVSASAQALYGRPASEFLADPMKWLGAVHPDDQDAVERAFRRVQETGEYDAVYRIVRADGAIRWVHDRGRIVKDAEGRPLRLDGIATDITERRVAEEALREREERLRAALAASGTGTFRWNIRTNELSWDAALDALFGLPPGKTVRSLESFIEKVHPDDRAGVVERCERCAREGADFSMEFRVAWPDGSVHWLDDRGKTFLDATGRPLHMTGACVDITERKRAEAALRDSERRYRTLFESNPNPMWVYDLESLRFLAVNNAAVAHYGYSQDEFLAMTLRDIRPPEDVSALLENVAAVDEGLDRAGIWRHRRRDGSLIDVEINSHVLEFAGRKAEVVLANDVTERRRAEARSAGERAVLELMASGTALSTVLNRLALSYEELFPGMLCSIQILDANEKQLRHGAAPSLPEAYCEVIDGEEVSPASGAFSAAAFIRQRVVVSDIATDPRWANYRDLATAHGLRASWSVPVISSEQRVLGTLALYARRPATPTPEEIAAIERGAHFASLAIERHDLLRSLQESQVRLHTLVANLPGMAYRCLNDPNWTMSYVSEGCEALTGYRRDDLEKNRMVTYGDLIHVDDRDWLWAKCQKALEAHIPCHNEYRIVDRHGRERWVLERASGVYAEDGALLAIDGFVQDITAARQAKIELEQLDRKMQETQKLESLGVLAGGIAHDFNNLLTGILGNASIAQLELAPGSSAQDSLQKITDASLRAADLCKQMLAYSGRGRFVVERHDLGELVEQTTQMLQLSISKKAVLRFHLQKGLPVVEVDATQIRQVVMNLVINASEAIDDKSGVISLSTGLARVDRNYLHGTLMEPDIPEGDYVFLEVSDSGCGMSPETVQRIFDPFFTTKFTGRGLGLAAVLGIVRGHKGALKVYSEVGRGTTFKLLFPAVAGSSDSRPATPPAVAEWQGSGTALIVDDEETLRTTLARMMRVLGLEPVLVRDGREAVELFSKDPARFAFVLLDLTMPHMDGEQTYTELRRIHPDVRVVLMSGFNAQEALVRFSGKGLSGFLQKPFTVDALRSVLQTVLA